MWVCNKCGEEIEDQFDSCWKCAGPPDSIGLPMQESTRHSLKSTLFILLMIPTTWMFFGPVAAFHHMFGFGITFYLVLNGEDPRPDDFVIGQYAIHFSLGRFILGVVLWLLLTFGLFRLMDFLPIVGVQNKSRVERN